MNVAVFEEVRPPEGAVHLPLGCREPPTRWFRGRFDEVEGVLPRFDRRPFALGTPDSHANELLDVVVSRPSARGGWSACPVGVVSKSYRLIAHDEAAALVASAMRGAGLEPEGLDTHASLTHHGARMALEVNLPSEWRMDPPDGHPVLLQLRCLNSVDGTSPLRVALVWYRLVCTNGLLVGTTRDRRSFAHRAATRLEDVEEFFARGLRDARVERLTMASWHEVPIAPEALAAFADGALKEAWGVVDAARFLHVARTGRDAELADRFQAGPPSAKRMVTTVAVPGSPEQARTAWDIAQALSWVARGRADAGEHLRRLMEIPALLDSLLDGGGPA